MGAGLAYAELDLRSNFSFLEGASHADELVLTAKALGLSAIGLADRNSLAGVVRAHVAAKAEGFRLLIGCRLVFLDGTELIVYPRDRAAYGHLCRLLSLGKMGDIHEGAEDQDPDADEDRIAKGDCRLTFEQAVALGEGLCNRSTTNLHSADTRLFGKDIDTQALSKNLGRYGSFGESVATMLMMPWVNPRGRHQRQFFVLTLRRS